MAVTMGPFNLAKMERAAEKLRDKLLRVTAKLNAAGIPYAVIGGNAVMAWVSRVDEEAVRTTRDVDVLIRRDNLPQVIAALSEIGFIHRRLDGLDVLLDGPTDRPKSAVHLFFANEKVKEHETIPNPDVADVEWVHEGYYIITLEKLVQMKLTAFRLIDKTHLVDLINLGLINASWKSRYPAALADRLQQLLDHPDTDPNRPRY